MTNPRQSEKPHKQQRNAPLLFLLSLMKRLGWGVLTLFGVSVVTFSLLQLVPADPAQLIAGSRTDPETIEAIKKDRGLDRPAVTQYAIFVRDVFTDNLKSYRNDDRVVSAIARRFPATLWLALTGLCVYLLIAVPVGLWTAGRAGTWQDRATLFLCLLALSVPTFWLGRLLQYYLGYELGLFNVGGAASWANLPLPAITLGLGGAAYYSRLLHVNLTGITHSDFIRAARARGLTERVVMFKHALKNALIPVVTILGLDFASLLSGLIFTEKIFAWPGIGSLAVDSVLNLDVPMIMGTVLFSALMVVVMNVVVDLVYHLIDPRVRV